MRLSKLAVSRSPVIAPPKARLRYSTRPLVDAGNVVRAPDRAPVRASHSTAFATSTADWPAKTLAGLARVGLGWPP
jgi:hypothetical protein